MQQNTTKEERGILDYEVLASGQRKRFLREAELELALASPTTQNRDYK